MIATINGEMVATARWSWYAAADGNGAWIASTHPGRLFSRDKAISAMILAWLLASGRTDDDPHVISLREELKWWRTGSSGSRQRWFTLPHDYQPARAIVDLSVDFDAVLPGTSTGTPSNVPADLKVTPSEIMAFLSTAWQTALVLPLAGTEDLLEMHPAGAPRLEFYIQNRRPENSGGQRTLRTLDMVDFSVFGATRRTQLSDMAVGVTAPLGLTTEETSALARQAMIRIAEDHAFTGAETADI